MTSEITKNRRFNVKLNDWVNDQNIFVLSILSGILPAIAGIHGSIGAHE